MAGHRASRGAGAGYTTGASRGAPACGGRWILPIVVAWDGLQGARSRFWRSVAWPAVRASILSAAGIVLVSLALFALLAPTRPWTMTDIVDLIEAREPDARDITKRRFDRETGYHGERPSK